MSDTGTPFVLTLPESTDLVQVYHQIAKSVIQEVDNIDKQGPKPEVAYDPKESMINIT